MANIKVIPTSPDIKVRVGQQNSLKVVSSVSGASGGKSIISDNVIGGIASVSQLHVSGISTFVGISTFKSNVYIDGNLYVDNDIFFDEFTATNSVITGISTVLGGLYYGNYSNNGISYFNSSGLMVSTDSPENGIDYSNYIMTTDNSGTPSWSNAIDGGEY